MPFTDKAAHLRRGEELDRSAIETFLKDALPHLEGSLSIKQFPSGYSNLTYLLKIGDREFVLRRPPFGRKAKTAHDMGREYRILSALNPVFSYCPKPILYTEDPAVIGAPFYVMERLRGIILRRDPPKGLSFTSDQARRLSENLFDLQVQLHSIDHEAIGLGKFGKPQGYVRRQVEGWIQRYRAAHTDDVPDYEEVISWIQAHVPPDSDRPCIIHNDFKLDNVVLEEKDPMRIIGILDWEMATIGDPLMDLGGALSYWMQGDDPQEMHLIRTVPYMEGFLTRQEILSRYQQRSDRPIEDFRFYYCFGLFRLAGIAQQIYYRYYHGQTQDERFKALVHAVIILERAALRILEGAPI
jgi:aminoglycoside phosphotransferase (APT) family kinase protein